MLFCMEIPFLKNKQNQGGGSVEVKRSSSEPNDNDLMDSIGQEFLDAIERKDIKALRSALEALVIYIQQQDQMQDEGDE